ncbi:uncharacterized protein LOC115244558 isoform X1 [Formica exsecta]|uniref:uncharacterized protein LOC115244558 isoform X1 n=2 Tax=Formica exsecta TaxID=72781 RepID=UPI00114318DE|nr:uncharacterized protein LOC115244558 isoform X1 [Formica exsecta]
MKSTTFEDFQIDERFKKLERSMKLAVLRKAHSDNGKVLPIAKSQPSISSTNLDSLDSSCRIPSLQTSMVQSEVLASSNNLRNLLLRKKNYKTNQEIMASSSIKQHNIKQDNHLNDRYVMPPPMRNTVYCTSKKTQGNISTLSNYETAASNFLNRPVQSSTMNTSSLNSAASYVSTNRNTNKEYLHSLAAPMTPTNNLQRIDRIFSKWKVMLNNHYELIIKGTLECGRVAHSKPVIRRYSATCVESKYKNIYSLQGNIVDETNVLPDYIRGKFHNGFPDDWENVYQIWRTYVSQGCRVTFRWPTRITDSDDDLKSELTELTCIRTTNNKTIPMEINESIEYIKSDSPSDKSSKNEKKYHNCSTHSFQRYEENTSFVKPFTSNFEKDIISIAQTRNIMSVHNEDNEQNIKSNVNPVVSSKGMNKLKDIIHEDKLHIIINNLADRNCSPKYIDKIIEMFECLDYIVSYKAKSECTDDSAVFVNYGMSSKPETIPLQSSLSCNNSCTNTNKFGNGIMEQSKNYMHPTDLRYGNIKDDSNSAQLSNPMNIKPEHYNNNDSDESESETYTGVPKISKIERVLHARKASRKIYNHKVRKKRENPQYNTKRIENESECAHAAISIANNNKSSFSESAISITKDEVKTINMRKCDEIINNAQRSREDTFCSHPRRNNFDVYGANKPAMQTEQPPDAFEAQRVNLNVLAKEQKVSHKIQENAYSQFVADTNYATNSNNDVKIISINMQKRDGNMIASHSNLKQDIVISSESDFPEKPLVLRESRREFIEQPKSETATKRSKPSIISSIPVNLKLKIKKADSKPEQLQASDVSIIEIEEGKQYTNIQPLEQVQKKKSVSKMSTVTTEATIANDSYSTTAANDKKKIFPTTNKDINPTNLTNPTIEQRKRNKLEIENNPKVLCAWMPKVMYYAKSKFQLGLTFEGNLLNEAGHVVHRKFTTDIVLKRLSATLIETVNHEFYKLFGHLKDNKHVIPKKLAKQCRNGCPANIEKFCLAWKSLQNCQIQTMSEKPHDTSMNSLNTSVSLRGRRIVPPLSYWTGERITLKDNNLVYDPGNSQESSLYSLIDSSKLSSEKTKKQKVNFKNTSEEQKQLFKSNEIPGTNKNQTIIIKKTPSSNKSPMTKAANSTKRSEKSNKSRKSRINGKRHIKQSLTFSSTDSSEEEQNVFPLKRMRTRPSTKREAPSQYTMTLRKRRKIEASPNSTKPQNSPTKKTRHNMTYTYYKDILPAEDFLSEVTSM